MRLQSTNSIRGAMRQHAGYTRNNGGLPYKWRLLQPGHKDSRQTRGRTDHLTLAEVQIYRLRKENMLS
jgi:hypothetical protein